MEDENKYIIYENSGLEVSKDGDDSIFIKNKISGATIKVSENYGKLDIEKVEDWGLLHIFSSEC